jgi:hypothetical protein
MQHGDFWRNRRLTQRAVDAGDSVRFTSIFLRLSLFLVGRLRRPRPSATNASRWAFDLQTSKVHMLIY